MKIASRVAVLPLLGLLLVPSLSYADGFVVPSVGVSFGGDAHRTLIGATQDASQIEYGVAVGWMGKGIFGVEGNFSYGPNFFGSGGGVDSSRVVTAMANAIVGIPIGGQVGGGVRPFVNGGIGLIRRDIHSGVALSDFSANDFGFDVGAGVMGYFSDHYGMRVDFQYFRNFDATTVNAIGLEVGNFNYYRGSVGFLFRF